MPKAFFAYSAIHDWDATTSDPAGKYYEERGINEFNVAISATTSAEVNDKAIAIGLAADYSYGQLEQTYQMAKTLRYKLMTDLTKRTEKKYSEEEFKKIMSL